MTLKTKIGLKMLSGVMAILVLSQVGQFIQTRRANQKMAEAGGTVLQERELQNVKNIHASLHFGLSECLSRGDMDVFGRLVALQRDVPGFEEFSLYDQKGRVAHSSDKAAKGRTLESGLLAQLRGSPERFVRTSATGIEIFKPEIATAKCLECHEDYKAGSMCGVTYFKFSNDASTRLAAQFGAMSAASSHQWQVLSLGVLILSVLMVAGLTLAITNPILNRLTGMAGQLKGHGTEVHLAAAQIAATSESLASGASQQAAALEETSASLTETASMTEQNAKNAAQACELASQARAAADQGVQETKAMAGAMQDLKTASNDIAKIVKTIDEIAFQTNILALNAAVEAARAGEAGMGFAVVAEEVRNLAQRSADAAKETAVKIEQTISKTTQGVNVSARVAAALGQIVENVHRVDQLIGEVANASRQQSDGMAQLNTAVSQMDQLTQTNAASAEEGSAAGQALNAQAQALRETVEQLTELIGGSLKDQATPASRVDASGQSGSLPSAQASLTTRECQRPKCRVAPKGADRLKTAKRS